jgi:hypothetical protein
VLAVTADSAEAKASKAEARTEWEAAASMVVEAAFMAVAEEGAVMLVEAAVTTER